MQDDLQNNHQTKPPYPKKNQEANQAEGALLKPPELNSQYQKRCGSWPESYSLGLRAMPLAGAEDEGPGKAPGRWRQKGKGAARMVQICILIG